MSTITDDDVTRADLAEALVHLAHHAKRQQHIYPGCPKWDDAHEKLDRMLEAWERAK